MKVCPQEYTTSNTFIVNQALHFFFLLPLTCLRFIKGYKLSKLTFYYLGPTRGPLTQRRNE